MECKVERTVFDEALTTSPLVTAHHGVFYLMDASSDEAALKLLASYAYRARESVADQFRVGEGLVGQCAADKRMLLISAVPEDYVQISSGLGEASPRNIVVLPVLFEGEVRAVLELATFDEFDEIRLTFLEQLAESIGIVLNTIAANMRTEELLRQSQALTESLQSQQEALTETNKRLEQQTRSLQQSEELLREQQDELQRTNAELEEKAQLLAGQKPSRDLGDDTPTSRGSAVPKAGHGGRRKKDGEEPEGGLEPQPQG